MGCCLPVRGVGRENGIFPHLPALAGHALRGTSKGYQKSNYKKKFQSMVMASLISDGSGKEVPAWLLQIG